MICVNPNTKEFKEILAQVGDPFEAEVEYVKRYGVKTNQRFAEQAPTQFDRDRLKAINELNDMVRNFRVDEILAEKGHDVKDFISNLETASNQDELDKIINKILYLLC